MLVLLFLFVFPAALRALTLDVSVGYDGYFVPGRWTPVSVTVENLPRADKRNDAPADFEGSVRLLSAGLAGESGPMLFTRELSVPASDRKRVTLYAKFTATGPDIELELVARSGRRVEAVRVPRKPVPSSQPLIAWFRTTDASISFPKIPDLPTPQIASIEPEQIPDRWYGYDGLSLLVIPRMLDKLLTSEQSRALHQWVAQGGTLLMVGGRFGTSYKGSLVEDLLPGRLSGSASYALNEGGLEPVAADAPSPEGSTPLVQLSLLEKASSATVHLAEGAVPLLYGGQFGSGRVFFLASDWSPRLFQRFPVHRFLSIHALTAPAFSGAATRLDTVFPYGNAGIYGLGKASALPDSGLVAAVLLSYLVLVGPANFYILARRKRLELAWITVPAVVIVFSVAIYGLGIWIRGTSSFHRAYHLVTGQTGASTLRCETLALTYLPQSRRETFTGASAETAALAHAVWTESGRGLLPGFAATPVMAAGAVDDAVRVVQGPDVMALDEKLVRQWAYDLTRFDSVLSLGGPVEAQVRLAGEKIEVTVCNGTSQPLHNLQLVLGQRTWKLGAGPSGSGETLAPGESVSTTLDRNQGSRPLSEVKGTGIDDPLSAQIFEAFIATLFATDPLRPDLPACFLVGRLDTVPAQAEISGKVGIRSSHSFFALTTPVDPGASGQPAWTIPIASRLLGEASGFFGMSRSDTVSVGTEPVTFGAALPAPLRPGESVVLGGWWGGSYRFAELPLACDVFDFGRWEWSPATMRPVRREQNSQAQDTAIGGVTLDNQLNPMRIVPDSSISPTHPFTGAVLVRFSQRKDREARGSIFVAPPVVQQYGTVSDPESAS